jgi:hypothetical protein
LKEVRTLDKELFAVALDGMGSAAESVRSQIAEIRASEVAAVQQSLLLAVVVQAGFIRDEAARLYEFRGRLDRDGWW